MKLNNLIVLDCESSGLNNESYPIEVGLALKNKSFSFLINPPKEWSYWNTESERIHKIKRKDLFDKGISIFDAVSILNSNLKGLTVYSDAVDFEIFWIDKLFSKVGIDRSFDIQSIYTLPLDFFKYKELKLRYSKSLILHRAESDALLIRKSILSSIDNY